MQDPQHLQSPEPIPAGPSASLTEPEHLTERELQIVRMIYEGKTSKRIAEALGISFVTVVHHRMSIMQKMDLVRQTVVEPRYRPS